MMLTLLRKLLTPSLDDMGSIDLEHLEHVLAREDMERQVLPEPRKQPLTRAGERIERDHWWKES